MNKKIAREKALLKQNKLTKPDEKPHAIPKINPESGIFLNSGMK
jgi:hypothetical protein